MGYHPPAVVTLRPWNLALLATLTVLFVGCQDSGRNTSVVVRDSSGIHIIENTTPAWADGRGWRISDQPSLHIGVSEGDSDYQLFQVVGALRLNDGRIVIANAGTGELRYFDPSGRLLRRTGRKGGGPGEFQGLTWLGTLRADSLITFDWRTRRVSIFDSNGDFVRSTTLETLATAPPSHVHVDLLSNGSLLIGAQRLFASPDVGSGVHNDTIYHIRFEPHGISCDTIGRRPGAESYILVHEGGLELLPLPFGHSPHTAAYRSGFYFGRGDSYIIGYYSSEGQLLRSIRKTHDRQSVTAADQHRFRKSMTEGIEDEQERRMIENLLADVPFPKTMPAYGNIIVDVEGNLWVEEYRRPWEDQPRWTVFNREGGLLGVVRTPPRLEIYQIGSDYVLGRWEDELRVEHVRQYELIKDQIEARSAVGVV